MVPHLRILSHLISSCFLGFMYSVLKYISNEGNFFKRQGKVNIFAWNIFLYHVKFIIHFTGKHLYWMNWAVFILSSLLISIILLLLISYNIILDFPGGSDGKASAYNSGDLGSIPGSGRSPGEGNGNLLQYSCLENPMDGGTW